MIGVVALSDLVRPRRLMSSLGAVVDAPVGLLVGERGASAMNVLHLASASPFNRVGLWWSETGYGKSWALSRGWTREDAL